MSVSVQQILADAKRLAGRLKDHDSSADLLLSQAQAMFCQVDAMKEVCGSNTIFVDLPETFPLYSIKKN